MIRTTKIRGKTEACKRTRGLLGVFDLRQRLVEVLAAITNLVRKFNGVAQNRAGLRETHCGKPQAGGAGTNKSDVACPTALSLGAA
jgi:hypothetical protein